MKLTGAAMLVSRGMKVLRSAPAAYPYRSAPKTGVPMDVPLIDVKGLALVPGPSHIDQPLYSFQVYDEIVGHDPDEVAAALLAIPGMRRSNSAEPASWDWAARWEDGDRWLDLDFTLMEPDDGVVWGGSNLRGRCRQSDLMNIWAALRNRFDGIWMHDAECRLYTPESFAERKIAEPGRCT
jgi:hypothetical protein